MNYQTFVENMWCKNYFKSFDKITVVSSNIIKHHTAAVTKIRTLLIDYVLNLVITFFLIKELANEVGNEQH